MCILFTYTSTKDDDGDYSLILASNRDEKYDRPALKMAPWEDDPHVLGGRDIQAGGTWFALSLLRKKFGVILNVPGADMNDAKSRGRLVTDYVKSDKNTEAYVSSMANYIKECNGFLLATVEFEKSNATVRAYCNVQDDLITYDEGCHGFGNCNLMKSLTKVEAGKEKFSEICKKLNKLDKKDQLIEELLALLKSKERHLPDPQLENRYSDPEIHKEFSSIYVSIPHARYGTRTHTLVLVTKNGHIDVIEVNMVAPIDPIKPNWEVSKYQFEMKN